MVNTILIVTDDIKDLETTRQNFINSLAKSGFKYSSDDNFVCIIRENLSIKMTLIQKSEICTQKNLKSFMGICITKKFKLSKDFQHLYGMYLSPYNIGELDLSVYGL